MQLTEGLLEEGVTAEEGIERWRSGGRRALVSGDGGAVRERGAGGRR
jgi:hypothetical protein